MTIYQTLQKDEFEHLKNTNSYPILLEEVKQWCNISLANTQKDFLIQEKIIPSVVEKWESETRFYLLDSERKGILDNKYCYFSKLRLEALNVRNITVIEYFPINYNGDSMFLLNLDEDVIFEYEIGFSTSKVHYKNGILNLNHQFENRLIIWYEAGYKNNDFLLLPKDIKKALLEMCCNEFNKTIGSCKESYDFWDKALNKYSVKNDPDSIYVDRVINYFPSGMLY